MCVRWLASVSALIAFSSQLKTRRRPNTFALFHDGVELIRFD